MVLLAQGVLIYGHFMGHGVLTWLAFSIFLIAFLVLTHIHSRHMRQEKIYKCKERLGLKNADRKMGEWVKFEDNGSEYVCGDHPHSRDLDLFGEASLFQHINDTNTYHGKEILKLLFLTHKRDKEAVLRRQRAIKEIAKNHNFCENIKVIGGMSKNISHDPAEMIRFFENGKTLFPSIFAGVVVRMFPIIIALLVTVNLIIGLNQALLIFTGIVVIAQVMIFVSISNKTEAVLKELGKFGSSLDDFGDMAGLIRQTEFSADLNRSWQAKLPQKWNLRRMTWALNARNITLLDLLLNILFLWDVHLVYALENTRRKGAADMRTWLEAIGYFEAMASVAVLPQLNPDWAYPEISDNMSIKATNIGHPLIEEHDRVTNNLELDGIAIISGSNMSGKTTFLRTVGINMVLMYMGAPVCATSFTAPSASIWTCMKPPDNLKQSISTFYAELLRIKNIIENDEPMLFLIDEIFAGTNSEDRIEGAKQVLLNLSKRQNLGIVTTHDLEVCKAGGFANHHFSEHYVGNEIHFDFKIKDGISTTRNARHLMKMIGIDIK